MWLILNYCKVKINKIISKIKGLEAPLNDLDYSEIKAEIQ